MVQQQYVNIGLYIFCIYMGVHFVLRLWKKARKNILLLNLISHKMSSLLHTIFIICMKVIFRLGMFIGIRCACNLYDTEFMCYFILLLLQNADCNKKSIKNLATLLTNIFKVQSMPIQHFTLKTMVARSVICLSSELKLLYFWMEASLLNQFVC